MEDSIKVFIRARPSSSSASSNNSPISLDEEARTVYISTTGAMNNNSTTMNKFQYSGVLGPNSDQRHVYTSLGVSNLIQNELLTGVNCCIIAYGQTGTGKTFTMYGHGWEGKEKDRERDKDGDSKVGLGPLPDVARDDSINSDVPSSSSSSSLSSSWGIVPRAVAELFQALEDAKAAASAAGKPREFPLQLRECGSGEASNTSTSTGTNLTGTGTGMGTAVYVRGLSVYRVFSGEEALALLRKGLKNRA
eukprot:gene38240-50165_t